MRRRSWWRSLATIATLVAAVSLLEGCGRRNGERRSSGDEEQGLRALTVDRVGKLAVCSATQPCPSGTRCELGFCEGRVKGTWVNRPDVTRPQDIGFVHPTGTFVPGLGPIVFGGYTGAGYSTPVSDLFVLRNNAWEKLATTGDRPPGGCCGALTFDSKHVWVYGGSGGGTALFKLDPVTLVWTQVPASATTWATPNLYDEFAFDSSRGVAVIAPGWDRFEPFLHMWEWNVTSGAWEKPAPNGGEPPWRYRHGIAYDASRSETVIFGGAGRTDPTMPPWNADITYDETWVWNGGERKWYHRTPANKPPPRATGTLVYDPDRRRTILYGGREVGGAPASTWEWNGEDWMSTGGVVGENHQIYKTVMSYVPAQKRVVAYGFGQTAEYYTVGNSCSTDLDCGNRQCVDGVCCEQRSCGGGQACNTVASPGVCAAATCGDCNDGNPATNDSCNAAAGVCSHVPIAYAVRDLGTPAAGAISVATDVNNAGVVVGTTSTAAGPSCRRAFRHRPGLGLELLPGPPAEACSTSVVVNDAGEIAFNAGAPEAYETWFFDGSAAQPIGTPAGAPDATPLAINAAGQLAVQHWRGGTISAFRHTPGVGFEALPPLAAGQNATPNHVTATGAVLGSVFPPAGIRAAVWTPDGVGGFLPEDLNGRLQPSSGWVLQRAKASNGTVIVGSGTLSGQPRGFVLDESTGAITSFGDTLPANASIFPSDVNQDGTIVGYYSVGGVNRAFVVRPGQPLRAVDEMLPPDSGWSVTHANAINDHGHIVGRGVVGGQEHAFLLTPTSPCADKSIGSSCSDLDPCNGEEVCTANGCESQPDTVPTCQDTPAPACQQNVCKPFVGCTTVPVEQPVACGTGCQAGTCQAGACVVDETKVPAMCTLRGELSCVIRRGSSAFTAVFGYTNTAKDNVHVAAGSAENVITGIPFQTQPSWFQGRGTSDGRRVAAFSVFARGGTIAWTLGNTTVEASASSPACVLDDPSCADGAVIEDRCVQLPADPKDHVASSLIGSTATGDGTTPGKVDGKLAVSNDGAATYSIPIAVPPGRVGLQPTLGLNYNSRHGDGPVGVGWTLTGVSQISRCKKTIAHDGAPRAIKFDKEDPFCIDGNRLVPAGAPDPAVGYPEYRTETETFSKIKVLSSDALGPVTFEVWSRDGRIHTYGGINGVLDLPRNTPTSTTRADNDTADSWGPNVRFSWWLIETRDRSGNTISYIYDTKRSTAANSAERILTNIEYTGTRDGTINPGHAVLLEYEDRPDAREQWVSGVKLATSQRLKKVTVSAVKDTIFGPPELPGIKTRQIIRTYTLGYRNDSVSKRSLLATVKECDAKGACKPETAFTWSLGTTDLLPVSFTIDVPTDYRASAMQLADFDGDGRDDLLYREHVGNVNAKVTQDKDVRYKVHLSQGRRFGPAMVVSLAAGRTYEAGDASRQDVIFQPPRAADVDMDGKAEVFAYQGPVNQVGGYWIRYNWTGGTSGFSSAGTEFAEFDTAHPSTDSKPPAMDPPLMIADLTGDNYVEVLKPLWTKKWQDVCAEVGAYAICQYPLGYRRNAAKLLGSYQEIFDPLIDPGEKTYLSGEGELGYTVDLDGDGRTEFLAYVFGTPQSFSNGPNFRYRAFSLSQSGAAQGEYINLRTEEGNAINYSATRYVFLDINGDGLKDAILTRPNDHKRDGVANGLYTSTVMTVANTGNGFGPVAFAYGDTYPPGTDMAEEGVGGVVKVIDINQDGREDFVFLDEGRRMVDQTTRTAPMLAVSQGKTFVTSSLPAVALSMNVPVRKYYSSSFGTRRPLVQVGDVDGDGLEDIVQVDSLGRLTAYFNAGFKADEIIGVRDGLGNTTEIAYRNIAEPLSGYVRATDCAYPQYCVNRGMSVVVQVAENTGTPSGRIVQYTFGGGRSDLLGRGWLGMGWKKEKDLATGAELTTTFDNKTRVNTWYPYAGLPDVETYQVTLGRGSTDVRTVTRDMDYSAAAAPWPLTFNTVLVKVVESERSATAGAMGTKTTTITYDPSGYGNVDTVTTTASDGVSYSKKTEYDILPDVWLLGLPKKITETSTSLYDPVATRVTKVKVNHTTGLGEGHTFQPDEPASNEYLDVTLSRDPYGNVTKVSERDATGTVLTTDIEYDAGDRTYPVLVRNPAGHVSRRAFHPGFGVVAAAVDANGLLTRMKYDGFGRLRVEDPPDDADTYIEYHYDRNGAMAVTSQRAGGPSTTVTLDRLGRPTLRSTTGSDGNPRLQTLKYDTPSFGVNQVSRWYREGTAPIFTTVEHDNMGQVRFTRDPDGTFTETAYEGRRLKMWDAKRNATYLDTDVHGKVLYSTSVKSDGLDLVTEYRYGAFGAVRHVISPKNLWTELRYDKRGRRTTLIDPDSGTTTYVYDGFGRLASEKDATGAVTDYDYDGIGRLLRIETSTGVDTFDWDRALHGVGAPALVTRNNAGKVGPPDVTTEYEYDELGRRRTTRLLLGPSTPFEATTSYDGYSRPSVVEYPEVAGTTRFSVWNRYNQHTGALERVGRPGDENFFHWKVDSRDVDERITDETFRNGVKTHRVFHPVRFVPETSLSTNGPAGQIVQSLSYGYDNNGNLETRAETAGVTESFTYDALDRLKTWTYAGANTWKFRYDYDDIGNLTARIVEQGTGSNLSFTYPTSSVRPHAVQSSPWGTYLYDDKGNQTKGPDRTVDYTAFNLPRKITKANGEATEFGYDAWHTRIYKRRGGTETVYLGDIYERRADGNGVTHVFSVLGASGPVAQIVRSAGANDEPLYLHAEHNGTVGAITDETGARRERFRFDPYGKRIDVNDPNREVSGTASPVRLGFAALEHDDEFALINMRGRIYDPRTTRFLTPDPLVAHPYFGQSLNRYAYALNNPLTFTDPTGYEPTVPGGSGSSAPPMPTIELRMRALPPVQSTPSTPVPATQSAPTPTAAQTDLQGSRSTQIATPSAPTNTLVNTSGSSSLRTQISSVVNTVTDFVAGFSVGTAAGNLPLGTFLFDMSGADRALVESSVSYAIGKAAGEVLGGVNLFFTGSAMAGLGVAATGATGLVAAPASLPVAAVGAAVAVSGVANIAKGLSDLGDALTSAGEKPSSLMQKQHGGGSEAKPVRNAKLAGKNHPVTGVPFDKNGFPDFSGVTKVEVKIKPTGNRTVDRRLANEAAGFERTPEGYVWHHHQDGVTMQLVDRFKHEKTAHTGGVGLMRQ